MPTNAFPGCPIEECGHPSHRVFTQGKPAQITKAAPHNSRLTAQAPLRRLRHLELCGIAPEPEKPRPFLAGASDCRKRCVHPLAPSARGLRPQAVGERTVRLSEIFRAMARFSPSAPSGHRSPSGASATSPVSGESVSQREVFRQAERPGAVILPFWGQFWGQSYQNVTTFAIR